MALYSSCTYKIAICETMESLMLSYFFQVSSSCCRIISLVMAPAFTPCKNWSKSISLLLFMPLTIAIGFAKISSSFSISSFLSLFLTYRSVFSSSLYASRSVFSSLSSTKKQSVSKLSFRISSIASCSIPPCSIPTSTISDV